MKCSFKKALPVWLKNLENDKNIQAEFSAEFGYAPDLTLNITGATTFRLYLNGKLIHYGPARTATGYARIDRISIADSMLNEKNLLKIETASYNCNSYDGIMQPGYIQAEITDAAGACLAATGYDFCAFRVFARVQKSMRYSFQRHFTEVWNLNYKPKPCEIEICANNLTYLERHAPLPDLTELNCPDVYTYGDFTVNENRKPHEYEYRWMDRFINGISENFIGYLPSELDANPLSIYLKTEYTLEHKTAQLPITLNCGQFMMSDLDKLQTGMIKLKFNAKKDSRMLVVFDEIIRGGRLAPSETVNIIQLDASGETDFTSFEVYSLKYLAIFVIGGEIDLHSIGIVSYKNPLPSPPNLNCSDKNVLSIYKAALETYRQNAVDLYTDCPGRERAGWLCDSYYTAMAEFAFTGKTAVEDAFIENYLLQSCPDIPKGMLPMCYPADHPNGDFIPQWAMWFVLEIDGYAKRNTNFDVDSFRDTAYNLLEFYGKYENEIGLLEDMPGWNFVEWSRANDWTKGVNFPTNMLYSHILLIVGQMFADSTLIKKSDRIKREVQRLSYNGEFFRDQAVRDGDGNLNCLPHISEVCQYYAFRFGIADRESFSNLHRTLICEFTPNRTIYPEIEKVNAFMGMYLRMELLKEWGEKNILIKEIKDFFAHMECMTGTLWEHKEPNGSLSHGFASYVGALLLEIYNKKS